MNARIVAQNNNNRNNKNMKNVKNKKYKLVVLERKIFLHWKLQGVTKSYIVKMIYS